MTEDRRAKIQRWRRAFSGRDNVSPDLGRYLWAACTVVFLGLTVYTVVWSDKPFDLFIYASAVATILAGGGFSLKIKEGTEPNGNAETKNDRPK